MVNTRSNTGAPQRADKSAEEASQGTTESTTATGMDATVSRYDLRTTSTTADTQATDNMSSGTSTLVEVRNDGKPGQGPRAEGGSNLTMVPLGPPRTPSIRSSRSRKKELEAKEELARLELEQAKAAAAFARVKLERLQMEEDSSSENELDPEDRTAHVQDWVQTTVREEIIMDKRNSAEPHETSSTRKSDIEVFATEIVKALNTRQQPPKYMHELPYFDGNSSEWIAFKTVYEDTASMFNDVQNIARIRKAVKGSAREAIKSLLYSECSPSEVLDALRRRFGRPESLVLCELEKNKTLVKPTDSARDICIFASQVNNSVAAIKGLDKPQYLHSPEIVKLIVDKLPTVLKYRWYDFAAEMDSHIPELVNISSFLNREADRCGAFATPENMEKGRRVMNKHATHTASNETRKYVTSEGTKKKAVCPHCEEDHYLNECRKFLNTSVDDRWEIVKKLRLCFKCLRNRHRNDACRRSGCSICKRWHHRLLHADPQQQTTDEQQQQHEQTTEMSTNLVATIKTKKAYLKMLPVILYGRKSSIMVLALLDEGSTISLLDSKVAEAIGADGPTEAFALQTVGGKCMMNANSRKLQLKIKGAHNHKMMRLKGVRTIDNLNLTPQRIEEVNISKYSHLKEIAHQVCYEEQAPKLLIGQDNWELIVTRSMKKGKSGQPVASMTSLGWVLHGCDVRQVNFIDQCLHLNEAEDDLDRLMKDHFSIESLGVAPKRPSTDADEKALQILNTTSKRLDCGRFEVGLLWKNKEERIPESRDMAERRLIILEKKLQKNKDLKAQYSAQISNLLEKGYAEEVSTVEARRKWYLPHFAVTHPQKKKIRVVFDAAAKTGGKCLNDMLLSGPDLLQSLFGVLLRFREGPVALAADIKEMFLQIRILPEDRDCLRFLWRENRNDPCKEYRMTSLIFGATSSPCTAIFIKNKNAEEEQDQHPEATRAIVKNHYMDDYLHSFRCEEQAKKIATEVDQIHRKAGFELRGWSSNRPLSLGTTNPEATEEKNEVAIISKEEKTLGMKWLTKEDALGFNTNLRNTPENVISGETAPTKRQVTSAVMSTFDPLGLIAPVLIQGKKLLQDIWRSGIGWDEKVKPQEEEAWQRYLTSLKIIKDLRIHRCIAPYNTEGELHVFCDASESAYSAAAYWKTTCEDKISVTLIAGKARVTPLKPISVPRLELQAALLSTRLAHTIRQELELKTIRTIYWTDSTTVLSWIQTDPRTFKTFVAHRLAEIEETTKPQQWRWVPTAMNPADDATRKIPNGFDSSHRWFTGPTFLYLPEEDWPKPKNLNTEKTGEEKHITVATTTVVDVQGTVTPDPSHHSRWLRLLRATARVLQFIELCKPREKVNAMRKKKGNQITSQKTDSSKHVSYNPLEEHFVEKAEKLLIQRNQQESFKEELRRISQNEPLQKNSRLRKLDVDIEDGLLRLRGRIDATQGVSRKFKRPAIVDGRHQIGRLLIAHYHQKFNHGNHQTVMNELRQKYCIIGLRTVIRSIASSCQWCRVYRAKPQDLPPGDLPIERLRHGAPPFQCTAVDYFGPMTVTIGRRHEKRWGVLFTCLTVRAVHIELAASLSTDSMILALRRFAARRGMPKTIFSDNGTNFVGANRELKASVEALRASELATATEHLGITWKFIPPGAPNMGGAWERLVRSVKTALEVTLHERHPKEEVLHTLILEAEHVVNSRPLTDVDLTEEEEALTPNHFLIGRSCGTTSIGIFSDRDLIGKSTWKTAQRLADHFWSRWMREYLPTLTPRRLNGKRINRELQVGDVVVIGDHTLPRGSWPRGVIKKTYPGPDGHVRVVDITTAGGVLRRPSTRVVVIIPFVSPIPEDGAAHEGENVGDKGLIKKYTAANQG